MQPDYTYKRKRTFGFNLGTPTQQLTKGMLEYLENLKPDRNGHGVLAVNWDERFESREGKIWASVTIIYLAWGCVPSDIEKKVIAAAAHVGCDDWKVTKRIDHIRTLERRDRNHDEPKEVREPKKPFQWE